MMCRALQSISGKHTEEFTQLLKTRDSHYRHNYIPKNSVGTRELLVPDWELSCHQGHILKNILYKIPVSYNARAYHKHRGLTNLAILHIGHDVFIHMGIEDFFCLNFLTNGLRGNSKRNRIPECCCRLFEPAVLL